MDILNQKLGNVGEVHISIVNGKLVLGVDGNLDLDAQIEALKKAHANDIWGGILTVAEVAIDKLSAAPVAAAAAT